MAHPPYPWWHFVNDFTWFTLLAIAFVLAFRSDIPARKTFIVLTGLMLAFPLLGGCTLLTLAMAAGLVAPSIQAITRKRKDKDRSSKAIENDVGIRAGGASSEASHG